MSCNYFFILYKYFISVKNIIGEEKLIKEYNIKLVNNEEILYIYLDFNSEFANLNSKKNTKKLKTEIKKYIRDNNIDFKGITVAIVVGGIVMGTVLLKNLDNSKNHVYNGTNSIVSIIDNNDKIIENIESDVATKNVIEDKTKEDILNVKEVKVEVDDTKKEDIKKENIVNVEKIKIKDNVVEEKNDIEKKDNNVIDKVKVDEEKSNLTYVTVYKSNGNVLNIELEKYLVGVVGAEMPASFNIEALKAQAVVARTYALKAIESGKRLTDTSSTQNYKSDSELKNMWGSSFKNYYNKVKSAVSDTKGIYLTYGGKYIDAVYHSTSNGKTEDAVNVWGRSEAYLKSVDSVYDNLNKSYSMNIYISYDEVSVKLNNVVNSETGFNIISRNESGRVSRIEVNGIAYSGVEFRNLLGLRSSDFVIEKTDSGINVTTEGYGHGVGMSQYGANGMANNGYDFKSILLHYYSGVKLNY